VRRWLASLLVILTCASSKAAADELVRTADAVRAKLEPSYLVVPLSISGLDPLWYEANIVAHFFVHRDDWPFAVVLTPKLVARLFRERSEPVKTPSYMPRLSLFLWTEDRLATGRSTAYGSIGVGHHSNGQAGDVFLPGGELNHDTGDFNTNYLEVAGHLIDRERRWLGWSRMSLEWHPWFAQQDRLIGRYGSLFAELEASIIEDLPLNGRIGASVGVILDAFQHGSDNAFVRQLERFPMSVSYAVGWPDIELALFARYYVGRDYYNIWFDRMVHMVQLGISSNVSPLVGSRGSQ
jgi:hypothetical protein